MTAPIALGTPLRRVRSVWVHMAGLSLVFTSAGMVVCAGVDVIEGGHGAAGLILAAGVTALVGEAMRRGSRVGEELNPRAVFVAVSLSWVITAVAGALPYLFTGLLGSFEGALFESISGFTCSGSSIFSAADFADATPGLLFWRQMTQWFGGMGIIVLAVAVLPFLGVGGLELIRAEAPGPTSDRLAPRVSETAKRLWAVYVIFTIASAVALFVTGIGWFDAAGLSLALVSTGGFAPEAASIGAYDSVAVEVVLIIGMVIGGASFTLLYAALKGRPLDYLRNSEFRAYVTGLFVGIAAVTVFLTTTGSAFGESLRMAAFNVVTLGTSTGFGNATGAGSPGDFALWAPAAQVVLLLFMWVGGMTGSTSGGMKVLRAQVMAGVAWRELRRAERPRIELPVKQGREVVGDAVVGRIAGFVLLYVVIVMAATLALTLAGNDILTGFSGAVSAMGNMGPALGEAGPASSFAVYSAPERMILAVLMLVGRLEVFPMVLSLVVAANWMSRRVRGR
ncbi:MAG: TrkH family potassium uptake protein [Microthrixaceae bacterium]|nr:TrkH family potassium uptake protein [Microthrixaceae bacterium]MCB9387973.1 TrkH family potassium uptake protein [Microthrixaceae bacterium]